VIGGNQNPFPRADRDPDRQLSERGDDGIGRERERFGRHGFGTAR
jgi:hypothetical protein